MWTQASSNACSSWSPIPAWARPANASDAVMAYCYGIDGKIWDTLLYDNCKSLLDEPDSEQTAKAALCSAWIAYRDTTCGFYDDKIRGLMSNMMHSACNMRETARRPILLSFFRWDDRLPACG
jgi:uncharacterized protein YecT (DUF1311 family)